MARNAATVARVPGHRPAYRAAQMPSGMPKPNVMISATKLRASVAGRRSPIFFRTGRSSLLLTRSP